MQLQLPLFMILCWLAVGTVHAPAALRAGSICAAPEVQRVHSKVHSAAARRGATHAPSALAPGDIVTVTLYACRRAPPSCAHGGHDSATYASPAEALTLRADR